MDGAGENEDGEAEDAGRPVDHGGGGEDEHPSLRRLGPESEGELMDEGRDAPNEGEGEGEDEGGEETVDRRCTDRLSLKPVCPLNPFYRSTDPSKTLRLTSRPAPCFHEVA